MKATLAALLGAAISGSINAACTREALTAALDGVLNSSAKLASDALITLNNKKVGSLDETPYPKIKTTTWTGLKPLAVDTEACQIATMRVSSDNIFSLRLRVDANGAINETEFVQAVAGGPDIFEPSGFPATTPAMYTEAQKPAAPPTIPTGWTEADGWTKIVSSLNAATCKAPSGSARLWTRKELIFAASSYVDGLKGAPFDACILGGDSCPRNENGVETSQNCAGDAGLFGFTSKGRRWVADTDTGVVLGNFYFANDDPSTLYVSEYFKVQQGTLAYAVATLATIPQAQAAASLF